MEDILTFISILFIVFGILQIILFFKIWGMTNNVSKIKQKYIRGDNDFSAQIAILDGEYDKAFSLFKNQFLTGLLDKYNDVRSLAEESYDYKNEVYLLTFDKEKSKFEQGLKNLGNGYTFDFSKYDSFQKMVELLG